VIGEKAYTVDNESVILRKVRDYSQLIKFRLSASVVFSAAMGYWLGAGTAFNWSAFLVLVVGGFMITGGSNGLNQVLEKDTDKLMSRTASRPLPDARMSVWEAALFSILLGGTGVILLWFYLNPLSGLLGLSALFLYTLVYTPMKKKSPFAVFVGAIPGAIPPMLGWVAATGELGFVAFLLFAIQFMWQFPHFWAIAWVLDDDYRKAGFHMLPSHKGRGKYSAFQILIYTFGVLVITGMPWFFGITGMVSFIFIAACSLLFLLQAIILFNDCSLASARRLMFGSFIYLPMVQIAMALDRI
jgi:protoheme IX farnesyltransferase